MTREEAINTLKEIKITLETYNSWSKTQSFSEYPQALEKAIYAIQGGDAEMNETKSPSADRPIGEWIDMNTETTSYYPRYKCSLCGNWANRSNYCPLCGARMKGGEDE